MSQFGQYEILGRLATGGMAEVFRARAHGVDGFAKDIVLKTILPQFASEDDFRRMFVNEARVCAELRHANVVQVLDFGKAGDRYFIAMEPVDGLDLYDLLTATRLPDGIALYVASELLKGLDYAHRKGIVHRDVSPSNVLLSTEGEVKLTDFGIARIAGRARETQLGIIRGKPKYMSPEQVTDQPLDARSDVFACGLILYEMLTGEHPLRGVGADELLRTVQQARIPRLSERHPSLAAYDDLVRRACMRKPADRFESAGEMQAAIEEIAAASRLPLSSRALAEIVRSSREGTSASRPLLDASEPTMVFSRETVASDTLPEFAERTQTAPAVPPIRTRTPPSREPAQSGAPEPEPMREPARHAPERAAEPARVRPRHGAAIVGAAVVAAVLAWGAAQWLWPPGGRASHEEWARLRPVVSGTPFAVPLDLETIAPSARPAATAATPRPASVPAGAAAAAPRVIDVPVARARAISYSEGDPLISVADGTARASRRIGPKDYQWMVLPVTLPSGSWRRVKSIEVCYAIQGDPWRNAIAETRVSGGDRVLLGGDGNRDGERKACYTRPSDREAKLATPLAVELLMTLDGPKSAIRVDAVRLTVE